MSENQVAYQGRKFGVKAQYAQGPVSAEFKTLLKNKIKSIQSDDELNALLNEIHDMTLVCRNEPNGLRAAVEYLKES